MKHAITTLQNELQRIKRKRESYERSRGEAPNQMRPSEWAMTIASLVVKERELSEAIAQLRGLKKDND